VRGSDVEAVCIVTSQQSVFDFVDALSQGNGKTAQKLLHRLLENEDPFSLWGMVVRQFRLLLQAREILDGRGNKDDVARAWACIPLWRKRHGTALDDVAKAARVTRGAIYWHFKGKADLYNTLVEEFSARGAAVVQAAVAEGGTLLDILRRVFISQCALIEDDRQARAVMELALFKTGHDPELQAGRRQSRSKPGMP
jgi:hypothetical protein